MEETIRIVVTETAGDGSRKTTQYYVGKEQYRRVAEALDGIEGVSIPEESILPQTNMMMDIMGKSLQRIVIYDRSEKPDDMDMNTVVGYHRAFGFVVADSKGKDRLNTHIG